MLDSTSQFQPLMIILNPIVGSTHTPRTWPMETSLQSSSIFPLLLPKLIPRIRTGPLGQLRPLNPEKFRREKHPCSTSSGPQLPHSQPPSEKDPNVVSGMLAVFSRAEDSIRVFFAVLFWMVVFFWGSTWDGRDNTKKGLRMRK